MATASPSVASRPGASCARRAATGASAAEHVRASLSRTPWLLAAAAGLLLGDAAAGVTTPAVAPLAAVSGTLTVALWHGGPAWRRCSVAVAAFAFACIAAHRVYRPQLPDDHVARVAGGARSAIEGVLLADAEVRPNGTRLHLLVRRIHGKGGWRPGSGRLLVSLWRSEREWNAGDRLRLRASLRRPRNFGNPGEFDYESHLARRAVYATAFAVDDRAFERLPEETGGNSFRIERWRRSLRRLFHEAAPDREARILRALILGDSWCLPADLRKAFRDAGVSHVLAISGLHVGLVAGSGYAFFRWVLSRSSFLLLAVNVPKTAVVFSLAPVVLYATIAGGSAATRRAVIMVVFFLGAVLVDRRRHLLVSLAAAAAAVILCAPGSSLEASFQLSFAAVLGLVVALQRFWPWWRQWEERRLVRLRGWRMRLWRPVAVYVTVSASALAATLPLTAFHFNHVSVLGLAANAVVVPLLGSVAVTLGLLAAACLPLSPSLAAGCVHVAAPVIAVGVRFVDLLAAVPHLAFRVVTPTAFEVLLVYGALLGLVRLAGRPRLVAGALLAILAGADAAWWCFDRYHRSDLRVHFLSVGQGDCAVIELPGGEVMVIDGGGSRSPTFDPGERIVAPFLWGRKIGRVDYLVLTHPQLDHYGGLAFLAEEFAAREFWSNGEEAPTARFERLRAALAANGARRRVLRRGARRRLGAVEAVVHSPAAGESHAETNDRSVVLSLRFGGQRILFAGDIEHTAEKHLLAAGEPLRSAVLKVPHHGSRTSSSAPFLAAVHPRLAVFSVGFRNPFGFPHADVVRRYGMLPSRIARTDLHGAVSVRLSSDGKLAVQPARTRKTGEHPALPPGSS